MLKSILQKLSRNKLLASGFWYTFAAFLTQIISFITLFIYPRLISDSEFGLINGFTSYLGIFMYIVTLGLHASISNAKYDFKEDFNGFLSSILFLSLIPLTVCIFVGVIFIKPISNLIHLKPSFLVLILIIQSFFSFILNFVNIKYSLDFSYKKSTIITLTNNVLILFLSIILIICLNHNKYLGVIYGTFIVNGIYAIVMYVKIMRKGKKLVDTSYWKYALKLSLPLIPHSLSGTLLNSVDRIMILAIIGATATGVYSFAYKIGTIIYYIWWAFNKAWLPWFYESMNKKQYKQIKEKTKYYILIFSLITFVFIFISPEIVKFIAPKKGALGKGINLVPIIMLSQFFIFLYSIPVNVEFYYKKNHYISLGTMLSVVVNILINYLLLPKYGFVASAWATLISYVFLYIYHYVVAIKIKSVVIWENKHFTYSIIFITFASIIFYFLKNNWIMRYSVILVTLLILCYKFRNLIKLYYGKLKTT